MNGQFGRDRRSFGLLIGRGDLPRDSSRSTEKQSENARKVILPLKNGVLGTCRWQFERAPLAGAVSGPHRDPRNLGRDGFLAGYQATQQGDAGVGRDAREEGARFSNLVGQIYALGDVQRRLRWDVATLAPGKAVAERCCVSRPFRPVHAARDGAGGVRGATGLIRQEREAHGLDPLAERPGGNPTRVRARAKHRVVRGEDPAVHRRYVNVL